MNKLPLDIYNKLYRKLNTTNLKSISLVSKQMRKSVSKSKQNRKIAATKASQIILPRTKRVIKAVENNPTIYRSESFLNYIVANQVITKITKANILRYVQYKYKQLVRFYSKDKLKDDIIWILKDLHNTSLSREKLIEYAVEIKHANSFTFDNHSIVTYIEGIFATIPKRSTRNITSQIKYFKKKYHGQKLCFIQ